MGIDFKPDVDIKKVWSLYDKTTQEIDYDALAAKSSYSPNETRERYSFFMNRSIDEILEKAFIDQYYWRALKTTYKDRATREGNPDLNTLDKANSFIARKTGKNRAIIPVLNFVYKHRKNLPLVLAAIEHPGLMYNYEMAAILDEIGAYIGANPDTGYTQTDLERALEQLPATANKLTGNNLPFVLKSYAIDLSWGKTTANSQTNNKNKNLTLIRTAQAQTRLPQDYATLNTRSMMAATHMAYTAAAVNPAINPQLYPVYITGINEIPEQALATLEGQYIATIMTVAPIVGEIRINQLSGGSDPAASTLQHELQQAGVSYTKNEFTQAIDSIQDKNMGAITQESFSWSNLAHMALNPEGKPTITIPLTTGSIILIDTQTQNIHFKDYAIPDSTQIDIYYLRDQGSGFAYYRDPANQALVRTNLETNIQNLTQQINLPDIPEELKETYRQQLQTYQATLSALNDLSNGKTPEGAMLAVKDMETNASGEGKAKANPQKIHQLFQFNPHTGKAEMRFANAFGAQLYINTEGTITGYLPLSKFSRPLGSFQLYFDTEGRFRLGTPIKIGGSAVGNISIGADGSLGGSIDFGKLFKMNQFGFSLGFDNHGISSFSLPFGHIGGAGGGPFWLGITRDGKWSISLMLCVGPLPIKELISIGGNENGDLVIHWIGGSLNISRLLGLSQKDPRPQRQPFPLTLEDGSMDFSTFWFRTCHWHLTGRDCVWNEVSSDKLEEQQARIKTIIDVYRELIARPPTSKELNNLYFYIGNGRVGDIIFTNHNEAVKNAAINAIKNDNINKCTTDSKSPLGYTCAIKDTNKAIYKKSDFDLSNWLKQIQEAAEQDPINQPDNQQNNNQQQNQTQENEQNDNRQLTPIAQPLPPNSGANANPTFKGSDSIFKGGTLISTGLSIMVIIGLVIIILTGWTIWEYKKKKRINNIIRNNFPPAQI